jgi:hypothetical protein
LATFLVGNTEISDPVEVSNAFNAHFTSIGALNFKRKTGMLSKPLAFRVDSFTTNFRMSVMLVSLTSKWLDAR